MSSLAPDDTELALPRDGDEHFDQEQIHLEPLISWHSDVFLVFEFSLLADLSPIGPDSINTLFERQLPFFAGLSFILKYPEISSRVVLELHWTIRDLVCLEAFIDVVYLGTLRLLDTSFIDERLGSDAVLFRLHLCLLEIVSHIHRETFWRRPREAAIHLIARITPGSGVNELLI